MKFPRFRVIFTGLALLGLLFATPGAAIAAGSQAGTSLFIPVVMSSTSAATVPGNVVDVQVGANMFSFSPQQVTIKVGDTVRWTWVSDVHTVTSGTVSGNTGVPDNKFCSPNDQTCSVPVAGNTGFVYQHTFTEAGTYPYYCAFHIANGMTGVVTVTP